MRRCILIFLFLVFLTGFSIKKFPMDAEASTSMRLFRITQADIADTDADYGAGCRATESSAIAQVVEDKCEIPAGTKTKFIGLGACIAVDTSISTCYLTLAVNGTDISSSRIELGNAGMNDVGECTYSPITSPIFYASGSNYQINVDPVTDGDCTDGSADLQILTVFIKMETRDE